MPTTQLQPGHDPYLEAARQLLSGGSDPYMDAARQLLAPKPPRSTQVPIGMGAVVPPREVTPDLTGAAATNTISLVGDMVSGAGIVAGEAMKRLPSIPGLINGAGVRTVGKRLESVGVDNPLTGAGEHVAMQALDAAERREPAADLVGLLADTQRAKIEGFADAVGYERSGGLAGIAEDVAGAVPHFAGGIGVTAGGTAAGGPLAGLAAGAAYFGATETLSKAAEIRDKLVEQGMGRKEARAAAAQGAAVYGLASGALEFVGLGGMMKSTRFVKALDKAVAKTSAGRTGAKVAGVAGAGLTEAATEDTQSLVGAAVTDWVSDEKGWGELQQYWNDWDARSRQAAVSMILGVTVRGGVEALDPSNYRSAEEMLAAIETEPVDAQSPRTGEDQGSEQGADEGTLGQSGTPDSPGTPRTTPDQTGMGNQRVPSPQSTPVRIVLKDAPVAPQPDSRLGDGTPMFKDRGQAEAYIQFKKERAIPGDKPLRVVEPLQGAAEPMFAVLEDDRLADAQARGEAQSAEVTEFAREAGREARQKPEPYAVESSPPVVRENGVEFSTGKPVSFAFARNTKKAQDFGGMYQQDIEPGGRYMIAVAEGAPTLPGWESGTAEFANPLVVPIHANPGENAYDEGSWKAELSRRFGGKTGSELSDAIRAAGHDGIVTYNTDKSGTATDTAEIVDLRASTPAPATTPPATPAPSTPTPQQQSDSRSSVPPVQKDTREPWEMARGEWSSAVKPTKVQNRLTPEERSNRAASFRLTHGQRAETHEKPFWTVPGSNVAYPTRKAALQSGHRASVQAAIASNKPVPPEVLAEYPDLAANAPKVSDDTDPFGDFLADTSRGTSNPKKGIEQPLAKTEVRRILDEAMGGVTKFEQSGKSLRASHDVEVEGLTDASGSDYIRLLGRVFGMDHRGELTRADTGGVVGIDSSRLDVGDAFDLDGERVEVIEADDQAVTLRIGDGERVLTKRGQHSEEHHQTDDVYGVPRGKLIPANKGSLKQAGVASKGNTQTVSLTEAPELSDAPEIDTVKAGEQPGGTVKPIADMTRDQLLAEAERLGVSGGAKSAPALRKRVDGARRWGHMRALQGPEYGRALQAMPDAERREFLDWRRTTDVGRMRSKAGTKAAATRTRKAEAADARIATPQGKRVVEAERRIAQLGKLLQSGVEPADSEWRAARRELDEASFAERMLNAATDPHIQDIRVDQNAKPFTLDAGPSPVKATRDGGIPWKVRHLEGSEPEVISGAEVRDNSQHPDGRVLHLYGIDKGTMGGSQGSLLVHFPAGDAEVSRRARRMVWQIANGKSRTVTVEQLRSEILGEEKDTAPTTGDKLRTIADRLESSAREANAKMNVPRGRSSGATLPPAYYANLVKIGAAKVLRGVAKFSDFAAQMIESEGDWIEPSLRDIYRDSLELAGDMETTETVPTTEEVTRRVNARREREANATSARVADIEADRADLGLDALDSPARRSWQEAHNTAKAQGIPGRAMQYAAEVNAKPRALSDIETAGLVQRAAELKKHHRQVMAQMADADPAHTATLAAEAARIESEFDALSEALRKSGTEKGRALASQRLALDQDFSLIAVKARAKAAKGESLTEKQEALITNLVRRLEDADARAAKAEARLKDAKAQQAVKTHKKNTKRPPKIRSVEFDAKLARARELLAKGCR